MDELSDRKHKSEIFKNYFGILALVAGGGWALYNFHILRTDYSAQLDLAEKESKLIAIDLAVDVTNIDSPCEEKIGLEINIILENKGHYPMTLNLANGKSGFGVSRLGNGNDGNGHPKVNRFYASIPYSFHFGGIWAEKKEVVALPNIVTKINYFVSVDEPGYYLASFFSEIPQDVLNLTNKHLKGVSDEKNELKIWSVSKYFSVTGREECK